MTSIEAFNQVLGRAAAGDNVGLLLRGVKHSEVERGLVVSAPRSIVAHSRFKSEVYVLSPEEGGRPKPFLSGYSPQFFFRTTDATGRVQTDSGVDMAIPGENVTLLVDLGKPVAIALGTQFAIREGGRTIGSGIVTEILD